MTEAGQAHQAATILITTVVFALIGPIGVRWAITTAGEAKR
jgi:hypothetical protein